MYAKVYDKLPKGLKTDQSQFADSEPNVLLISFAGLGMRADEPPVGWVLDELMTERRMVHTLAPDGITDITLDAWIDLTAKELVLRGQLDEDYFVDNFGKIMSAPRRLGGVLLFDGDSLYGSRINYNAYDSCRLSHAEMFHLEEIFSAEATWWR